MTEAFTEAVATGEVTLDPPPVTHGPTPLEALLARAQAAAQANEPYPGAVADPEAQSRAAARRARILALDLPVTIEDEDLLADDALRDDLGTSLPTVRAWLRDARRQPWLWLVGPTGRGKTLAACWALLAWRAGRLVGGRELERLHMTRFGDATVEAYERVCRDRSLLVIDDVGREDTAAKMGTALLDIADRRRGSGHLTIVTANVGEETLRKRYPDPRLWSRLAGCSQWCEDRGPDLRKPTP